MLANIKPKTEIVAPSTLEELEALRIFHGREIRPELIGIHSLNPAAHHNSPSRSVMMTQHIPQHLIINDSEPPLVNSGLEFQLGKYTFATRIPHTGYVRRIVKRYQKELSEDSINGTPEISIIYSKEANGEFDVVNLKEWRSFHQYFGFRNKFTETASLLKVGNYYPEGTKLADTPANTRDEFYTYGVNFSTCCMDVPGVAEDGVIIARSALKRLRVKLYEVREISFGSKYFPLNLFGGITKYKIFKDIGEQVRLDGLLMAIRPHNDFISPVSMGQKELQNVDHIFDKKLYTRTTDVPEGLEHHNYLSSKVIDIKVIRNFDAGRHLPPTMTEQLEKYAVAYQKYCKELLNFEQQVNYEAKQKNSKAIFSGELTRMLNEARAISGQTQSRLHGGNVGLQYRRTPLDEFTVTFVIEHELEPNLGWKLTGKHGDSQSK